LKRTPSLSEGVAQAEECLLCKCEALISDHIPTKKERNPISTNKKVSVVVQTYHPSYVGSINGTIIVQTSQSINAKPYSNNKTRDTNMKDS
jgi:hypothetical protein